MKTAVSIPDPLFAEAERTARRLGWSRSQLYTQAVREFVAAQGEDPVTAALDALAVELGSEGLSNAGRALIAEGKWEW